MKKLNNHIPYKLLGFIAVFFVMSIALYGQDSTRSFYPPATGNQNPAGNQNQPGTIKQSPQSVSFNDDARMLSKTLADRCGLSENQAGKISQVLIDYKNNIADARNKDIQKSPDRDRTSDVTGGRSRVDMTGILGDNVSQYYSDASDELMSEYKNADQKADDQIKDVLQNDTQKTQYNQVKNQWWNDVKERVFSSVGQNDIRGQQQMDDQSH